MIFIKKPSERAREWLTDDALLKVTAWARDGLTDKQISQNMGIAYSTFSVWKAKHRELSVALKTGKEVVDIQVENALHKRAIGFYYDEEKTYIEEVSGVIKKRKEIFKRYAIPDTTAQIFWLKNRKPNVWRNKIEIEDTGDIKKLDMLLEGIKNVADE